MVENQIVVYENWKVYIHENKVNNHKYVGISMSNNIPKYRWGSSGVNYRSQPFYRAIKKYEWNGFYHTIFLFNLRKSDANAIEKMLIAHYKSNDGIHGYNATVGGDDCNAGLPSVNRKDISNQRFGRLIAIKPTEYKNKRLFWRCKCDCGKIVEVSYSDLVFDNTKSCGCKNYDRIKELKPNTHEIIGDKVHIFLRKIHIETGEYFILDIDQYEKIKKYTWYVDSNKHIVSEVKGYGNIRIECLLFDITKEKIKRAKFHHKNGNIFDFTKTNCEIVYPINCNKEEYLFFLKSTENNNILWINSSLRWRVFYGCKSKTFKKLNDAISFNNELLETEPQQGSVFYLKRRSVYE